MPGPRWAIGAIGAIALAVTVVGAAFLLASPGGRGGNDAAALESASGPSTSTSSPATTTTALVIEHDSLAPFEREVATVHDGVAEVIVRRTPPAGWDSTLSPVVTPAPADSPPLSALDIDRVPLPSLDQSIAGRVATGGGWVFANPGEYEPPQPLVFGVVSRQGPWVQVQVPVRPNGTVGWIRDTLVDLTVTRLRIEVSVGHRRLELLDGDRLVFEAPVAVGRPSSPTPTGSFYVTDLVPSIDPSGPYGPIALALNGYSEVMDSFGSASVAGSPDDVAPVLAIHGTNRPASIGQAASNGCPRLSDDDILRLASLAPAGTPVEIWP